MEHLKDASPVPPRLPLSPSLTVVAREFPGSLMQHFLSHSSICDEGDSVSLEACIPIKHLDINETPFAAGGAGQVYCGKLRRGQDVVDVAAKRTFLMMFGSDMTEFDRELTFLAKLAHPNVVRLFG